MSRTSRRAIISSAGLSHRSAGFQGAQKLSNAGSGRFQGPSGTNAFTSFWVKLDTIAAATYYSLFDIGPVASEVMGMRIDGPTGHLVSFKYDQNGVFGTVDSGFTLLAGQWYQVQGNWGAVVSNTIYDHNGAVVGGGSASPAGDGSYRATATPPLSLAARSDTTFPVIGEIDSFAHWRSGNVGAVAGFPAYLANGGKALDYSGYASGAFSAATLAFLSTWYNLDEQAGATIWSDQSVNSVPLTAIGTIISQPGAGY